MRPVALHSYLLWRSSVEPDTRALARHRFTACASLLPALLVGLFVFGWYAGLVVATALVSAFLADFAAHRWLFRSPVGVSDGAWLFTGLLVALLLPPAVPLWVPFLGAAAAVLIGKHWLAVDGMPLLQPAAVGVLLLHLFLFPYMHPEAEVQGKMAPQWPVLSRAIAKHQGQGLWKYIAREFLGGDIRRSVDRQQYRDEVFQFRQPHWRDNTPAEAVFGPRPLDAVKVAEQHHPPLPADDVAGAAHYEPLDLLVGYTPGPIGGASALALILGLLLVVFTEAGSWLTLCLPVAGLAFLLFVGGGAAGPLALWLSVLALLALGLLWLARIGPVSWLAPCAGLLTLAGLLTVQGSPNVGLHLLSGPTLLGFFYLLGDPATGPRSKWGKVLAGVLAGLLEWALRSFTPLAEGTFISPVAVLALSYFLDKYVAVPKLTPRPGSSAMTISSLGRL